MKEKWNVQGLIGVIHLPALMGDPNDTGKTLPEILAFSLKDAETLVAGGIRSMIIENFGSAPFPKGTRQQPMPPHHTAIMSIVAHEIRKAYPEVVLGINCLRNDAEAAMGIAAAVGAQFIRVNVLTGAYVTDQGVIEGNAYDLLRYRQLLGMNHIAILADVLVKHAVPLAPTSATDATKDILHRAGADAVIVTGAGTGEPVDRRLLEEVSLAAGNAPVLLGSGTRAESLANYGSFISGAIVGTSIKRDGMVTNEVDLSRVQKLVKAYDAIVKN